MYMYSKCKAGTFLTLKTYLILPPTFSASALDVGFAFKEQKT